MSGVKTPDEPLFSSALLVEDDRNLSIAISSALKKLKIPTSVVATIAKARQQLPVTRPDLIVLDRRLPDGDGLSLCAELRSHSYRGIILVISAVGEMPERVKGLETGADDYLPKPFAWEEFHARLRALARRRVLPAMPEDQELWTLDHQRLRIYGRKGWVELTPLEFKLAQHLISAGGSILSREQLLKEVWGFSLLPQTRTVDLFMSRLRKLLEIDSENPKHFLTVRGAGYRFEKNL